MNLLQEIAIRFLIHRAAFTTDVSKMYNTVKLCEEHWCCQRYVWQEELDPQRIPEEKMIAEKIGENSIELARQRSQELEQVVNKGGFQLKGIVISGEDPPETMSENQQSVTVAGMKWFPKQDVISLNIGEMNFAPKRRGKKSASSTNIIPDKLTRRHCASKVGEVFDLLGRVTPITAQFKLDLHDLVIQKFDWDDVLPDHLRKLWINNFEMMQEINQLKYQRTIVPSDAINLEVETLDFADARMSQPRAELYAALLNSHTGEVVRKSLENWHQSAIKFCDSQIVLHWLSNDKKTLKQWVRSRVIESLRFTRSNQWFYVQSDHMIADIGTRRGPSIPDVDNDSRWFKGDPWMKLNYSEMPIVKISDIKMSKSEESQAAVEIYHSEVHHSKQSNPIIRIMDEVNKRLEFSNYLISPLKYQFRKVVNIMAIIFKYFRALRKRRKSPTNSPLPLKADSSFVFLVEEDITSAKNYFFRKATQEIKKFLPSKGIKDITSEQHSILKYTGRILDTNDITIVG
ncbi:uncharacterized protein [Clytia hemisphaerica]|uniref:uncharacterized protein n=1 Tax=Clytia hemisphaerica TaxID=252671 RepID=UPI0034D46C11